MFELVFGFRLPKHINCTKNDCPQPCPFSYKCKTWLEKEFVPIKKTDDFVLTKDTQLVFESDKFNKIGCTSFIPTTEELIKIKEMHDEKFNKN